MTFMEGTTFSDEKKQYRQCSMRKKMPDGSFQVYVAFLPTKFAKVGKTVGIKIGEEWNDGYQIEEVGPVRGISEMDLSRENQKRFKWVLGE